MFSAPRSAKVLLTCVVLVWGTIDTCAAADLKQAILGKWVEVKEPDGFVHEYTADGTYTLSSGKATIKGTYKIAGDEFEANMAGVSAKGKLKITGDEMEIFAGSSVVKKFKRAPAK